MASNRKPRIFTKTMFYIEGNPAASLVTNKGGLHQESIMEFPQAESALDWCRQNGATFVYSPVDLFKN